MPHYKLTYFASRGRGETARVLFALADVKFEKNDIVFDQWGTECQNKEKYPTGSMPTLEIDGEVFPDSMAINHFLAREFKLAGRTNLEQLKVDGVLATVEDILAKIWPALFCPDEGTRNEMLKIPVKMAEKKLPFIFAAIAKSGGPYICGDYLSVADVYLAELSTTAENVLAEIHSKFPALLKHQQAVLANHRVKKYKEENKYEVAM